MASIIGSGINGNYSRPQSLLGSWVGKWLLLLEVELMETCDDCYKIGEYFSNLMASIIGSGINGNILFTMVTQAIVLGGMASIIGSGINGNLRQKSQA